MRNMVLQYLVVLGVFLAIDAAWLMTAGRSLYVTEIGSLLRERPNLVVAFLFYALFAFSLLVFVIGPATATGISAKTLAMAALFGLTAYATYDLTNLATIKGFTTKIAIVDMVWGAFLSTVVTAIALWLIRLFKLA